MAAYDDFEQQQLDLMQRRKTAREGQAFNMPQGQMVSGHYVAPHFTQILAEGLRGYADMKGEQKATQDLKDLSTQRRQGLAAALKQYGQDMNPSQLGMGATNLVQDALPDDLKTVTLPNNYGARVPDATGALERLASNPYSSSLGMEMFKTNAAKQLEKAQAKAETQGYANIISANAGNPQAAVRAGVPSKVVEDYYNAKNIGKNKVGRTIEVAGPNGKKMIQQLDEYGTPVGQATEGYIAPQLINQGNKSTFALPVAGQSFNINMTPGESARLAQSASQFAATQGAPTFNESAGGFVYKPTAQNPTGKVVPVAGLANNKPMTEDQSKASGWLVQATNAYGNMQKAMKADPESTKPGFPEILQEIPSMGLTTGAANMLRSAPRQQFLQGASSLSESLLRAATGAGVNKDEAVQKIKELTPVFGEDPETTRQKMEAIPLYIESLKMRAGPGARKVESIMTNSGGGGGVVDFGSLK